MVYNIFAEIKKLEKQGKKIIDLSLGQSGFKSPKHAVDATIQALRENISKTIEKIDKMLK